MWAAALREGLGGVLLGWAGAAAGWQAAYLRAAVAGGAGARAAAVPVVGAGAGGGGARAGVPGLEGLRGVGGGVRAGVRGVDDDESVGHHTEDVNNNFGVRCTASKREIGVEGRYDRYDVSEGATLLWSVKHALTPRLPTPFGGRARG